MGIAVAFLTVFYLPFLPFNNFSNYIHNIEKGHPQIILKSFLKEKIVNMIFFSKQKINKSACMYTTLVSIDPQYFVPESCTGQKILNVFLKYI